MKELYVDETWAEANKSACSELPKVEITTLDLQWLQVPMTAPQRAVHSPQFTASVMNRLYKTLDPSVGPPIRHGKHSPRLRNLAGYVGPPE